MGNEPSPPVPPPHASPDGKHYWDGVRWVSIAPQPVQAPMVGQRRSNPATTATIVGIVAIAGLVVFGLIWYFGVYDTAEGRCNRGDLGACVVVAGRQAAAAQASAAAAQASADAAQASASAAAEQQRVDEINRLNAAMASGCTVVWNAYQDNNMRLTYIGSNSSANCASAKTQGWLAASRVDGSTIVCADSNLVVEDTGGRLLGSDLCRQLKLEIWP